MAKAKKESSEEVGFHKGALTTLAKERQELMRLLGIVEQLMQMHVSSLKELGVDIEKELKEKKPKKPIEDMVK